ncbi:amidohydrolase family protein [Microbacterium sp. M28]|uniref:amidohydrolase family protein n=1 Tax=Microbacterium sp. M28 TaxID=2962064 RepID=UPI0021F48D85|nr:amidohydrolase family protein [Microbacterium sp. M28]UYO97446.1 amidohydrolase family protein [Microbacterium sp. M28]
MRIVDAHIHLWDRTRHPLSWFRDDMGLAPRVTAADLEAEAAVDAAIAVQAADTLEEAAWLTEQAARSPMLSRIVLQYSPAPGAWAGVAARALGPEVAGLRAAIPQHAADLSDVVELDALADGLARTDRVLEFLIRPDQLPGVAALADRHPDLTVVLCHLGLGAGDPTPGWRADLVDVARRSTVHAKLSGVVGARTDHELQEISDAALAAFGPHRLMFGSDWPMSARNLHHSDVVSATARMLSALSRDDAASVWHGTADRVYALGAS